MRRDFRRHFWMGMGGPFGMRFGQPWGFRGGPFGFPRRENYLRMLREYKEELEEMQRDIAEELSEVEKEIEELTGE